MNLISDRTLFRRFLARNIDYLLWTMVLNVFNMLIFNFQTLESILSYILVGVVLFSLVEAATLVKWGTTPGKKIFGLNFSEPFTWKRALSRSVYANGLGMSFGLMVLSPLGWTISLVYYAKKKKMPWDQKENEVTLVPTSLLNIFIVLLGIILLAQALSFLSLKLNSKPNSQNTSLIQSPHEERILDKVDIFFFEPNKSTETVYSDICVAAALEYARVHKQSLDFDKIADYCGPGIRKLRLNYSKVLESKLKSCGFGVSIGIREVHQINKEEVPDMPSSEDEAFYKTYCEGTYNE